MKITILKFDELGSTNTEALGQARAGAAEGVTVFAKRQTAGRGRHGRVWESAEDAGLAASIILRPRVSSEDFPLLTLMTAVAVADFLRGTCSLNPDIKWVNDVLIGDRKISGILAEMTETDHGPAIVIGIGINLTSSNFPGELGETATSIEAESGKKISPDDALDGLLGYFGYVYDRFCEAPAEILEEWATRSSYYRGKAVSVRTGGEMLGGITDGLEPNGALRLRLNDGSLRIIQTGDVERLR